MGVFGVKKSETKLRFLQSGELATSLSNQVHKRKVLKKSLNAPKTKNPHFLQ
jgi:hypothetical protein